jgi:DNA-binding MarR family transcriptional regulator
MGLNVRLCGVLNLLAEGPISQQELGEQLGIDRTTVVELIDELERKGAVVRKRNPTDRRSYALSLTPRGRTVQKRASRAFDDAANEFFDSIKPTERQALAEMLRRLITSADQKLKNG